MELVKLIDIIGCSHKKKNSKEILIQAGFDVSRLETGDFSSYALFTHKFYDIRLTFLVVDDFEMYYGEPKSEIDDYSSDNYILISVDIDNIDEQIKSTVNLPFKLSFESDKDTLLKQIEKDEKAQSRKRALSLTSPLVLD